LSFQEDCRSKLLRHLQVSSCHYGVLQADATILVRDADIESTEAFWDPDWEVDSGKLLAGVRVGVGRPL